MNRKVHVRFGGGPLEKYPYGQLAGGLSYLTLPSDVARSLDLTPRGSRDVVLADGGLVALDVFRARVAWHGRERPVSVLVVEATPSSACPSSAVASSASGWRATARSLSKSFAAKDEHTFGHSPS